MSKGLLVPDEMVLALFKQRLASPTRKTEQFSTVIRARWRRPRRWTRCWREAGRKVDAVASIEVGLDE